MSEKTAKSLVLLARKLRKGIRPYRVSTFLAKHGSVPGQDLRLPVLGGTKFPTQDSLGLSKKLLSSSQNSAEVGPNPSKKRLQAPGPDVSEIVPNTGGRNIMPKLASSEEYSTDPLVAYLRMENESRTLRSNYDYDKGVSNMNTPTTGRPDRSDVCPCGRLEVNEEDMRLGEESHPRVDGYPYMPREEAEEIRSDLKEYLGDKFTTSRGFRRKGSEKDHPYAGESTSVVDRILNS
jgi:hypothetical protein